MRLLKFYGFLWILLYEFFSTLLQVVDIIVSFDGDKEYIFVNGLDLVRNL